jgi:hypothetical protein
MENYYNAEQMGGQQSQPPPPESAPANDDKAPVEKKSYIILLGQHNTCKSALLHRLEKHFEIGDESIPVPDQALGPTIGHELGKVEVGDRKLLILEIGAAWNPRGHLRLSSKFLESASVVTIMLNAVESVDSLNMKEATSTGEGSTEELINTLLPLINKDTVIFIVISTHEVTSSKPQLIDLKIVNEMIVEPFSKKLENTRRFEVSEMNVWNGKGYSAFKDKLLQYF